MKSPLSKGDGAEISKSQEEKPKGPDWSKAPKNNTQARRDWYTKNKLKQDETTKVKSDTDTKPSTASKSSETKDDKPKTKTRKQMRAEKRVGRLKKKQEKKGALTPGQQKRLDRNKSKAKGEKVQEKDKTNVGKAIKKGVDKVKDSVAKKIDSGEISTGKKTRQELNKM